MVFTLTRINPMVVKINVRKMNVRITESLDLSIRFPLHCLLSRTIVSHKVVWFGPEALERKDL